MGPVHGNLVRKVVLAALVCSWAPVSAGVRIQLVQGRPVVDGVFVNGHGPFRFLLDTATTANHLEWDLARSIGLKPTFRSQLTSSIGVIEAVGSTGIEVTLGPARADDQRFLFAGMEMVHKLSPEIQGILGQQFLSRFDYLLAMRARQLEFGSLRPGGDRTRVELRNRNGRPVVSTSLGELAVDSGADWVTLFGVDHIMPARMVRTMSGSSPVGIVASQLRIEGRTFWRGEAAAIPRAAEADVAGLLPVRLFRSVYICNSGGYALFE